MQSNVTTSHHIVEACSYSLLEHIYEKHSAKKEYFMQQVGLLPYVGGFFAPGSTSTPSEALRALEGWGDTVRAVSKVVEQLVLDVSLCWGY
jgi:hypothetical protein